MYWEVDPACDGDLTCQDGTCVCKNPCSDGDNMCYLTVGKVSCIGPDLNGCYGWSDTITCDAGYMCSKELNECVQLTPPECDHVNECDYEGQRTCQAIDKYRECHYGAGGCLVWDCGT